ncbi:helix-turn-helix domain-containing protein [Streptomyces xiamenensis]|uniref:helix-turn-helix domain-containing protein n=1 Tax=Streptomyces xiamenensis TaxID=408015 RepID=UPI0036E1891E
MAKPGATVRRYVLGLELKRLRNAVDVTQGEAAACIDTDDSRISRIESGASPISRPELSELLRRYGLESGDDLYDFLIVLHRDSRKRGWWHQQRGAIPTSVQQLIELESSASRMVQFSTTVIPGLLQTESYARALISTFPIPSSGSMEKAVEVRMTRQKVLTDEAAPQFICLLDEATLHRQVGGPETQAAQLRHLLTVSNPPALTIRVLPYHGGVHAGVDGGFKLFSYPSPTSMEFAFVEYLGGHIFVEGDTAVSAFRHTAERLQDQALSSDDSMKLITRIARDPDESS